MIGHKIFVEGVDGAGKTTYINRIINQNPDMNYEIIHCTRHTKNDLKFFMDVLTSERNIILDRSYVGQFVYNDVKDRASNMWMSLSDLQELERVMINRFIPDGYLELVYVYCDIDVCLANCKKDSEDNYYTREYIQDLHNRYIYFFDHISSVEFTRYFNDYHPSQLDEIVEDDYVDYSSFDYDSLPKIVAVDFDGTLVEDRFPDIGKLNEKLKYELTSGVFKNYKKVLFTNRSGENLIKACNFCAQNGIYFDAVNDDIPEVKNRLKRNPVDHRKIWFDAIIDDKAVPIDEFR